MRILFQHALLITCLLVPAAARAGDGAKVTIDNFTFTPAKLVIHKGTEVIWANHDDIPHTIVLTSINVRSKATDTGETFSYRFDKAGSFAYICGLHPHMHGQIVVK